ncbi:MAG: hypothetical protein GY847_28160 [Proteobacteria bacterium]|nr:hypothetical protein [Pseudomonadota bacterium]
MLDRHKHPSSLSVSCLAAFLTVILSAGNASATEVGSEKIFGAGPILGEPTGGTVKWFIGGQFAIQGSAAITFWDGNNLGVFFDFIWYPHMITENEHFMLTWYFGGGIGAGIRAPWNAPKHNDWEADPSIWLRVPFGFSFLFERVPVEAFIEFGPTNRVYPSWNIRVFVAVGGRWYF